MLLSDILEQVFFFKKNKLLSLFSSNYYFFNKRTIEEVGWTILILGDKITRRTSENNKLVFNCSLGYYMNYQRKTVPARVKQPRLY